MSRRRLAALIVCTVFLSLIAMTVRSMFIEDEALVEIDDDSRDATSLHAAYTGSVYRSERSGEEAEGIHAEIGDRTDAGIPDLFTRELTRCARSDCWSRHRSGDAGVVHIVLPPRPPKVR